ncbi:unnamed protein product [Caretta caretta]
MAQPMGFHLDKGEHQDVVRVVVMPDVHQGVMFYYFLEDVRCGGVKVPAQDQELARIQGAEKGGRLLIETQPLRVRCRGINVNKVDHELLRTDPEVQQAA